MTYVPYVNCVPVLFTPSAPRPVLASGMHQPLPVLLVRVYAELDPALRLESRRVSVPGARLEFTLLLGKDVLHGLLGVLVTGARVVVLLDWELGCLDTRKLESGADQERAVGRHRVVDGDVEVPEVGVFASRRPLLLWSRDVDVQHPAVPHVKEADMVVCDSSCAKRE